MNTNTLESHATRYKIKVIYRDLLYNFCDQIFFNVHIYEKLLTLPSTKSKFVSLGRIKRLLIWNKILLSQAHKHLSYCLTIYTQDMFYRGLPHSLAKDDFALFQTTYIFSKNPYLLMTSFCFLKPNCCLSFYAPCQVFIQRFSTIASLEF